jgi:hypothetical protein
MSEATILVVDDEAPTSIVLITSSRLSGWVAM